MSYLDQILAQPTTEHSLVQGESDWHAFRLQHKGASEAAAALGMSKNMTRTELLHAKHTGIPREFSDFVQKRVLDKGHEVEALALPYIEELVGQPLYPVTFSRGGLSASCDGITMDGVTATEHKQWNAELAKLVASGIVPIEHMPQCQQIMLVTDAEQVYFVVSDGTPERMVFTIVKPDRVWWERIAAAWEQFDKDLAAYVPVIIQEMPQAEVTLELPALFIHAKGEITASNLKEYGAALADRLKAVRAIALVTDQDFSNAKASAQLLRENIEQAKLTKNAMLAETATVGEAARMIDAWCEDMRLTALQLEKDVEREDLAKKAAMIAGTKAAYEQYVRELEAGISPCRLVQPFPVFAEAIKNKRSFTSMQDALNTKLANAKAAAELEVQGIRINLALLEKNKPLAFLFPDIAQIANRANDDFANLVTARIAKHEAAEAQRLAAEREGIRAEEKARADREARERLEREAAEARASDARIQAEAAKAQTAIADARQSEELPAPVLAELSKATAFIASDSAANAVIATARVPARPADTGARIRLGEINALLSPIALSSAALVKSRIADHKAAEAERIEKQREAIRKEEAARLEREAAEARASDARIQAEAVKAQAAIDAARQSDEMPAPVLTELSKATAFIASDSAANAAIATARVPARPADTGARIRLGEINALLSPIALSSEGLKTLGFEHVATDKSAKLYRASDFRFICTALIDHIDAVQTNQAA